MKLIHDPHFLQFAFDQLTQLPQGLCPCGLKPMFNVEITYNRDSLQAAILDDSDLAKLDLPIELEGARLVQVRCEALCHTCNKSGFILQVNMVVSPAWAEELDAGAYLN
ncbi:MAG: hypothetical protein OEX12_01235 [Gammaproteobacteria bacterium]|nr:hypothetical protein [Gammaproteobacteria bacterium]